MVGCRANEIENLLTAEPRVASEKEKNRYLKFVTATKRGHLKKGEKQIYKEVSLGDMQKGQWEKVISQILVKRSKMAWW